MFQNEVIRDLRELLHGCFILKNDPELYQGIPDLTIFYRDRWAVLEIKGYETSPHQPNQDYYVGVFNEMSYAAFIYPENKSQIFKELHDHFTLA